METDSSVTEIGDQRCNWMQSNQQQQQRKPETHKMYWRQWKESGTKRQLALAFL